VGGFHTLVSTAGGVAAEPAQRAVTPFVEASPADCVRRWRQQLCYVDVTSRALRVHMCGNAMLTGASKPQSAALSSNATRPIISKPQTSAISVGRQAFFCSWKLSCQHTSVAQLLISPPMRQRPAHTAVQLHSSEPVLLHVFATVHVPLCNLNRALQLTVPLR
jgi:hypothetical protein